MSEGASGNPGAAIVWPDEHSAEVAVQRMQTKLHQWAGADGSRRFGDLFNLVYDPAFLAHAWYRVAGNKGARTAGIDKVTVARVQARVGVPEFLEHVRGLLKSGEFRPSPVRQVMIPKAKTNSVSTTRSLTWVDASDVDAAETPRAPG
ncbi:MAG: hypothetical protein GEU86_22050 [Actinophytocola sp.]|nr:hypothetical protein [Actinophytocola sp.]